MTGPVRETDASTGADAEADGRSGRAAETDGRTGAVAEAECKSSRVAEAGGLDRPGQLARRSWAYVADIRSNSSRVRPIASMSSASSRS